MKSIFSEIKRRFYGRFTHNLETPLDRRRSLFFAEWIDFGFLRHRWTNEGEVAPGVIRTNNPDEKRWAGYAKRGIKTVLNLRNDTERAPFKLAQEACDTHGMRLVSFPMFPRHAPPRETLLGLIDLFPTLEKPILMHCKSGADRTGLVAAIWLLTQEGASLATAREELSLRYIHRRDSETGVLDEVLDAYAPFEGEMDFRAWVETTYDPVAADAAYQAHRPRRGALRTIRHFYKDVYAYAQYRELVWHQSFAKPVETEEDAKRARFFMKWIDHGVLRGLWTNYHKVGDGVFRSNHPTEQRFRKYATQGVRTIVNLRGASMEPQYQLEKRICDELGFQLIDIPMSGTLAPSKDNMLELLECFETAERPMIIHCKSGADRTGFASALYQLTQGLPFQKARAQLSLKYLHLRGGTKGILGWVLDQYQVEAAASGTSIREWVENKYDPEALTKGFRALRGIGGFQAIPASMPNGTTGKKIAVVTSVRNDTMFLDRWLEYYGRAFGNTSLFVILDGFDQPVPKFDGATFIRVPYIPRNVVAGDKARAARASKLAEALFEDFDIVIGTDVDEFITVDPSLGVSLATYLSNLDGYYPLSPLGLDVAQHTSLEAKIQPNQKFLAQRGFAKISDRYTKASVLRMPMTWGSGYHRVRGQNFRIDENLYLFHFGSIDQGISEKRAQDTDRIREGWSGHQARRDALFEDIAKAQPIDGDDRFATARREMEKRRSIYAWNKPGILRKDAIIRIPERFKDVV